MMRTALVLGLLLSACGGDSSSDDSSASSSSNTVSVSGSLVLGELTDSEEEETGLTSGETVTDGEIFAMMFPDQSTTTDTDGSFTLEIDLGSSPDDETPDLEIMTWVSKTNDDGETNRLGLRSSVNGDINDPVTLGSLTLIYTMGVHIDVQDASGDPVDGCEISVRDMGSRISSEKTGAAGRYDVDYLPEGEYTFLINCDGYDEAEFLYDVPAADRFDDWVTPDPVEVTASQ